MSELFLVTSHNAFAKLREKSVIVAPILKARNSKYSKNKRSRKTIPLTNSRAK
jgi:hypothetical protein